MSAAAALPRRADPFRDLLVVDARAPRFNQAVVATGALTAVLTGAWPILAVLGLQLGVSVVFGRRYCLPCVAYFAFIQPRFGEGPLEDSRAPRFANLIGFVVLSAASVAYALGASTVGAVLGGLVAALAGLATTTGLCVGCELYKLLARVRGVKGGQLTLVDLQELGATPAAPHVVLFTHPLCSECHTKAEALSSTQTPHVVVDVSKRKDLAKKYGVTVVPFAVKVDATGRVLAPA